jgi:hypothetical protein
MDDLKNQVINTRRILNTELPLPVPLNIETLKVPANRETLLTAVGVIVTSLETLRDLFRDTDDYDQEFKQAKHVIEIIQRISPYYPDQINFHHVTAKSQFDSYFEKAFFPKEKKHERDDDSDDDSDDDTASGSKRTRSGGGRRMSYRSRKMKKHKKSKSHKKIRKGKRTKRRRY